MKPAHSTARAREDMERKCRRWSRAVRDRPPPRGWIREMREALGMSAGQLARFLGVSRAAVSALEKAEVNGHVRLNSLRKAAEAMHCQLAYALVPKKPLSEILQHRAYGIVMPEVVRIVHKEKLHVSDMVINAMIAKLIEQRGLIERPRQLWNHHPLPHGYFRPQAKEGPKNKDDEG